VREPRVRVVVAVVSVLVVPLIVEPLLVVLWSAVELGVVVVVVVLVLAPVLGVVVVLVLVLGVGLGDVCDPPVDVLGLVALVPVPADGVLLPVPVCATAMPTPATRTAVAAARLKPLGNWLILKLLIPVDARPEADR
jgi:hypothetical protein